MKKKNDMTLANLALKFNAKLGGTNHRIPFSESSFLGKDTMIVGIDVTHPSAASVERMPSICAVVASTDVHYSQWPGSIRLQPQLRTVSEKGKESWRPQEIVGEMEDMMRERLDLYKGINGKLPRQILVYRDGVSESQYGEVLQKEYSALDKACNEAYKPAQQTKPQVSILVVTKRHHTRFYPAKANDADDKKGNPKPGTVVDRGITMEQGFDFYLQAHEAIQGTVSRPTCNILHLGPY